MMQHLLHAFLQKQHLMVVWLSRCMIVLCQGFLHQFCVHFVKLVFSLELEHKNNQHLLTFNSKQ